MEPQDKDIKRWVDSRLRALNPADDWKPDPELALARLRDRNRTARTGRRRWIWVAAAAAAGSICLIALLSPQACANPRGCAQSFWQAVFAKRAAVTPVAPAPPPPVPAVTAPQVQAPLPNPPVAAKHPAKPAVTHAGAATRILTHYKESGSPTAPLACEIYTDYECPACAVLYREIVPQLVAQYVQTGKLKLLHRDFPLSQHPFARLAARYANAAGQLGHYEVVVERIFRTQAVWSGDGDVDSQVALVLPPGVMQKVREMVKNDPHLEDTVAADMAMGRQDQLTQTPTLVIVSKDKRQPISGAPNYAMLKSYLDQLLEQR